MSEESDRKQDPAEGSRAVIDRELARQSQKEAPKAPSEPAPDAGTGSPQGSVPPA